MCCLGYISNVSQYISILKICSPSSTRCHENSFILHAAKKMAQFMIVIVAIEAQGVAASAICCTYRVPIYYRLSKMS